MSNQTSPQSNSSNQQNANKGSTDRNIAYVKNKVKIVGPGLTQTKRREGNTCYFL